MSDSAVSSPTSSAGSHIKRRFPIGAESLGGVQTHVRVWAPAARGVTVVLESRASTPLHDEGGGYFSGIVEAEVGARYGIQLDGRTELLPDPASRFQPDGPHGVSEVVDPRAFQWSDAEWIGPRREGQVIYELHVGTFTPEGTWSAAERQLKELA